MNTQVIFNTDKELKDKALKKAQSEGVTLKAVLSNCMKYYVEGKLSFKIQLTQEPELEVIEVAPSTQKKMNKIAKLLEKI